MCAALSPLQKTTLSGTGRTIAFIPTPRSRLQEVDAPDDPNGPGYLPLPAYGEALVQDAAGNYIPAIDTDPCSPTFGQPFDVVAADPINTGIMNRFGQDIGGVQKLTLTPGYYPGGIKLTTGNEIKLLPGVYAFGGGNDNGDKSGLVVGGGTLDAVGVMIYVTASNTPTSYWGQIKLTGGEVIIHESYDGDPGADPYASQGYGINTDFKYIALYQDRANPEVITINGNSDFDLKGSLYFPTAHVALGGTGFDAGTQFICGSLETAGNTEVTINYDGRFFTAGYRSILVE
jgi:hypothetical protein